MANPMKTWRVGQRVHMADARYRVIRILKTRVWIGRWMGMDAGAQVLSISKRDGGDWKEVQIRGGRIPIVTA